MYPSITEQRYQQSGGVVHNHVLLVEAGSAVYEAQQLDDAGHVIEVAQLLVERAQAGEDAQPRRLLCALHVYVEPDLAGDESLRPARPSARDEDEITGAHGTGVLPGGPPRGEGEAEIFDAAGDFAH